MAKTNEDGNVALGNGKTLVPPHNLHLARKLNVVKCRVNLYKIPPKCIKFEPTATHFYVDTLKFTKKYYLNIPYPEGVTVDTNVEATFDSGVLLCDFPIVADPNKPADLDKVVEARELVKEMRKNGIPIPTELAEVAKLAKTKERADDREGEGGDGAATSKNKKTKKVLSNKEKRQKEKSKRALENDGELDDPTTARKKKKAKVQQKEPKKKTFLDNADEALRMADSVNEKQEMEMQAKIDKEYSKLSVDTRKRIERKDKKAQLRALRKEEAEKAMEKMPKKEKHKKKVSKVSFAE